jgi:hypothetical protein
MNFRHLLEAQGVSSADVDEAVRSARQVTRVVSLASDFLAEGLLKVATKVKNERGKAVVHKCAYVATQIHLGAQQMLAEKR